MRAAVLMPLQGIGPRRARCAAGSVGDRRIKAYHPEGQENCCE